MSRLLVIGNGFDCNLGEKTTYVDFFSSWFYEAIREKVSKWVDCYNAIGLVMSPFKDITDVDLDFTCWDLLFYIESVESKHSKIKIYEKREEIKWSDVESVICESIINKLSDGFSWEIVKGKMSVDLENLIRRKSDYNNMMAYFIRVFDKNDDFKDYSFYQGLLSDLQRFEQTFGSYISSSLSKDYQNKARNLACALYVCEDTEKLYIDSFNYSDFVTSNTIIRHINGTTSNPIFGIDLSEEMQQKHLESRRFTKTARRLYQDAHHLNKMRVPFIDKIESAVVFGHSLNEMDYDYFYYLFTTLHFNSLDISRMGTIEFVYSIYDDKKTDEIRNKYSDAIYELLNAYENQISGSNQHVLINLLRFSGKLRITEI